MFKLLKKVNLSFVCLGLLLAANGSRATAQTAFGRAVALPGQISEIFVDEARRLVYAANYTAGRLEIVGMDDLARVGSIAVSPSVSAVSAMAVSPDGRWLVATSQPADFGTSPTGGVTVVNLDDPGNRRHLVFPEQPVGAAFGSDGRALILTRESFFLFDPTDGSYAKILSLTEGTGASGSVVLPAPLPELTREMQTVHMTSSSDFRWIFGVAEEFVFSYAVRQPVGMLTVRSREGLVHQPAFDQVAAAGNGGVFLAGQLLFTNDLRVIADSPEAALRDENTNFVGGAGVDDEGEVVYASFPDSSTASQLRTQAQLLVMDAENLRVRKRLRLAERITGRIAVVENGATLFAVSESGLLHLPLGKLRAQPQIEANAADRNLVFDFDFCTSGPISRTLRLETAGGEPASFEFTPQTGVLFEPHQGMTPAQVKVTVDPAAFGGAQGSVVLPVEIQTNAVNAPLPVRIVANVRDVDQRGSMYPAAGRAVSVVGDPYRDRFYLLDDENFQVVAYDTNEMRQVAAYATGNSPRWMSLTRDGAFLVVANSRSESVTVIDLHNERTLGKLYLPWQSFGGGHYPSSLTALGSEIVIASQRPDERWQLDMMNLPSKAVWTRPTLGVFANDFETAIAVAGNADGTEAIVAEEAGNVYLYDSGSKRLVISRSDFADTGLSGTVGGGRGYYVAGSRLLNRSLLYVADLMGAGYGSVGSGFTVLPDGSGVYSSMYSGSVHSGVVQMIDSADPGRALSGRRLADAPPASDEGYPFSSTLGSLRDGRLVSASAGGVVVLPTSFEGDNSSPRIAAVTNAADFKKGVAPGGLISIFGDRLAPKAEAAVATPLPTKVANVCVSANGMPLPLLYVSSNQINAQLPFYLAGPVDVQVHSPNGVSDVFIEEVGASAPAIFGVHGPDSRRYATVYRTTNNQLATLSNPVRPNETLVVYLTGLGPVSPAAIAGVPASSSILSQTAAPAVAIGGVPAEVQFSGLAPGYVGLYQLNVRLPGDAPLGMEVPLTIGLGGAATTVNLRVVD